MPAAACYIAAAMTETNEANEQGPGRWALIRDIAVFQLKLLLDGFRDLILVPISLVTGIVGIINYGKGGGSEFYDLLRMGRRSEIWINLFGAANRDAENRSMADEAALTNMDEVVARVETFIVDEYRKGGVTAQAKSRLDKALDSLTDLAGRERNDKDM